MYFPEQKEKIKAESQRLSAAMRNQIASYLVAAFGLVAGLAWNDAIKALIDYLFPLDKNSVSAKFLYAGLITALAVLFTNYIVRLLAKKDEV